MQRDNNEPRKSSNNPEQLPVRCVRADIEDFTRKRLNGGLE